MAGPAPKPTALKRLAGNPGKRPLNENEPRFAVGYMSAPRNLSADARREWKRVSRELLGVGLLTKVDRAALAAYCQAWGTWLEAERKLQEDGRVLVTDKGYAYQSPWVGIANAAVDQMRRFACEFGMTPASRTRIHVEKKERELSLAEVLFAEVGNG